MDSGWRSKSFSKTFQKMKDAEKVFDDSQRQLREEGTEQNGDFQNQVKEGRRKAGMLGKMKEWGGPITCQEDLTKLLEDFVGWETKKPQSAANKKLKSILRQEIVHARDYFFTNMKKSGNPLFKLNKLSVKEHVENLKVLFGKQGEEITADVEDGRDALELILKGDDPKSDDLESDLAISKTVELEGDPVIDDSKQTETDIYSKDQSVVFIHNSKLFLGVSEEVNPDKLWIIPLENAVKRFSRNKKICEVWKYPGNIVILEVSRSDLLPVWPVLELEKQISRNKYGQVIYFRLLNDDIITMFISEDD